MAAQPIVAWQIPLTPIRKADKRKFSIDLTVVQSDDDLVEAAKLGDPEAFSQLVQRYQRVCFAKAYSILRTHGDAEDEVQSAWVRVWTHLDTYHGQGAFGAWLSRIITNGCLMRLRKARIAPMTSVDEVYDSESSFRLEVIDQSALPEQSFGDDEVLRLLTKEIDRVPPLLRKVLIMRDIRQYAMQDIAEDLGISLSAVKSRLMRARLELRKRLDKHQGNGKGCVAVSGKRRSTATYVLASCTQ